MTWHEPSEDQRKYLEKLLNNFWKPIFKNFEEGAFKKEIKKEYEASNIMNNFESIVQHVINGQESTLKPL